MLDAPAAVDCRAALAMTGSDVVHLGSIKAQGMVTLNVGLASNAKRLKVKAITI